MSNPRPNLYLLWGEDAFRRSEFLNELRRQIDTDGNLGNNTIRFDKTEAKTLTAGELQNACQSGSFFDEGRLLIIEGLQARFSGIRRGRRAANAPPPDFSPFVAVLARIPQTTVVVLLDDSSGAFFDALQEECPESYLVVRPFPKLKAPEVKAWAQQRVKERGLDFAPVALDRLLSLVDGAHLGELANELDKLSLYALGRRVTVEDINVLGVAALDTMAWDITDPVVAGRPGQAIAAIQAADEKDFHPMVIMAMIRNQFRRLVLGQGLLREGATEAQVGETLNLKGYPLTKLMENLRRFTGDRLERAYRLILQADVNIKTGVMDVETVLPLLIVELAELQRGPALAAGRSYR